MTNRMQDDLNNGTKGSSDEAEGTRRPEVTRRRLLGVASGVAPVLMTLHSRPVMAVSCVTASASTSLNPSGIARAQSKVFSCTGWSPARWSQEGASGWPIDKGKSTFNEIFQPDLVDNPKLFWLLGRHGLVGSGRLAQACAATYLNALKGWVPLGFFGGFGSVQAVWSAANSGGPAGKSGFSPTAGVYWSHDEVAAWLATTWDGWAGSKPPKPPDAPPRFNQP